MSIKRNVLIIGGGGREHAIAWTLKQSAHVGKLYCIPGNAGIAEIAECVPALSVLDFDGILSFLREHGDIYLTVVGPDDPLARGLVDCLTAHGHRAFGPTAQAARIESSKAFSKELMQKYNIPTAKHRVFDSYDPALRYIRQPDTAFPLVVKADGLALGKGVIICQDRAEAENAVTSMLRDGAFGASGSKVVIEEFLKGYEVSILAFTDGETIRPMITAQDHKRALDGNKGLNTGGMGAFSPSLQYDRALDAYIMDKILAPTIGALRGEGIKYKGVLYFGLMIDGNDVRVLEYNARFGDPEAQSVLPLLDTDLFEIFEAIIDGRLADIDIKWKPKAAVCIVLASGGYPLNYEKGKAIEIGQLDDGIILFHSGTVRGADGRLLTNGGRVLGVACVADDVYAAREKVYRNIPKIKFDAMHYRTDIARRETL